MSDLPERRSESVFEDFKPAYTTRQAVVEANRCLYCYDAPCIQACPTGIDIPEFIRKIGTGNVKGSARTILESNILGMSCARVCPVEVLCVGDCVYNELGVPPIQIGKLQRYATDAAFEEGWQFFEAGPDTGRSVGIVGAGPAGLAAAHRLRMHGHAVTLYDRRDLTGGLNTTGVAPYKMRADRSLDEVAYVLSIGGIEVRTGVRIPDDLSWDALSEQHDALFLGFGLGPDSWLDLPGRNLPGVVGAVDLIEQLKLGTVDLESVRTALVIGGGNTALDVVRELRGVGVPDVRMVYRRSEADMSGYAHEWSAGKDEGVSAVWEAQPLVFIGDLQVSGLRVEQRGSTVDLPADLVVLAVGQKKLSELVAGLEGVVLERGRIVTDAHGATGRPGVYAGGDCRNGGKEVVNAVAEGRDAAEAIHAWLTGGA